MNEQATPTQTTPTDTPTAPRQRHYLAVFFLGFMWGTFGVDRFYLGKIGTGILKLLTFGGFGLWVLIDMVIIMTGAMRDKQGRPMLQFEEYKKFSYHVVLWFAVILGAAILLGGLGIIAGLYYLVTSFMDGTLMQAVPAIPGLDALNGLPTEEEIMNL